MPLWGSAAEVHLNRAQVLLNTAARWITGLGRKTKVRMLMEELDWLTIREQVMVSTAIQTWKLVHLGVPAWLLDRMRILHDKKIETSETETDLLFKLLSLASDLPLEQSRR